ncbi:imidazole glycerol phosphate synthase subunit HisH [Aminirod propionatiphilus]|uniref:Imidazole glycerol phosphate synthase subunit HisH n=1 Tax=Aminirod propionatiphilus TaxID=3415223 RepID=A0ACD1DT08_9BACT|nr:imidazole glycerol phosphate synthase subunit HisH [Synergistota bacterium]
MIAVIDYGAGNVTNVVRALARLGREARILSEPVPIDAELYVLPGVGAFPPAMERLRDRGWETFLRRWAAAGGPLLGICLGMQLLCEKSLEDGSTEGLGFIGGTVSLLEGTKRLPHMGWNDMVPLPACPVAGGPFYFVHSYALKASDDGKAFTDVDGRSFVSLVARDSVAGCQFHPERSGLEGVAFLGRLIEHLMKEGTR